MANSYPMGQRITFTVRIKLASTGALVDPAPVTFKIKRPDTGVVVTYTYPPAGNITRDSEGNYQSAYTCDFPGDWYIRWEGAGAYIGANEWKICIMESAFG